MFWSLWRADDRGTGQGQSLVDLALVLPIFLLTMLGVASLGMALYQQTSLSQTTQQAAQYLVEHPITTDSHCSASAIGTSGYAPCAQNIVANYLASHNTAGAQVSVSFSVTASGVLMDTIAVSKKVAVPVPLPAMINSGPLHGSSIWVSATTSTIAAIPLWKTPGPASSCPVVHPTIVWTAYNPATSPLTATVSISGTQTAVNWSVKGPKSSTITESCTGSSPSPENSTYQLSIAEQDGLAATVAISATSAITPSLTAS